MSRSFTRSLTFTFLFKIPGGHKYFRDDLGRIAVADDSGKTPMHTDNGPLYVDTTSPIAFGQSAVIRVTNPEGEKYTITEFAEGGIEVAVKLGMKINAAGHNYTICPESV